MALGFKLGLGFRIWGLGFGVMVWGLGVIRFRVLGCRSGLAFKCTPNHVP